MGYTNEKLAAIAAKLKTMPVIEKKKQEQDAIKVLAKEIAALQKRGYTLDQIAETLRGEGLDITTPTLKSYLQRIKAGKNKDQKKEQKNTTPAATQKEPDTAKASFTPKTDSDDI